MVFQHGPRVSPENLLSRSLHLDGFYYLFILFANTILTYLIIIFTYYMEWKSLGLKTKVLS